VPDAFVIDALRTPVGRYGGALPDVRPDDLAGRVIRAAVDRNGIDPERIDDVVFAREIVAVSVNGARGAEPRVVEVDEGPRRDTSLERLAALRPIFREEGTVTAGNASPINDGAACLVIGSERAARALGHEPLARVVATGVAGVDPAYGVGQGLATIIENPAA
jgi:acetyl-CoA acetyltransferase